MLNNSINICVQNHGDRRMVEDCLIIVRTCLHDAGYEVSVTESLTAEIPNVVIDEFTNYHFNLYLKQFKQENPFAEVFVVLTEFFTARWGVESLNFFGGIGQAALNAWLRVLVKKYRNDLGTITSVELARALLMLPFLLLPAFANARYWFCGRLGESMREQLYFLIRYLGLYAASPLVDGWISLHPQIAKNAPSCILRGKYLGAIYPVISEAGMKTFYERNKHLGIMFSGSLTAYRKRFFKQFSVAMLCLGVHRRIGPVRIKPVHHADGWPDEFFSFHPPKTKNSCYSSPVRLYRAIEIDTTVPVIPVKYRQHPIEDLCLFYENRFSIDEVINVYQRKTEFLSEFLCKLIKYNELASSNNKETMLRLGEVVMNNAIRVGRA